MRHLIQENQMRMGYSKGLLCEGVRQHIDTLRVLSNVSDHDRKT